jgi:hypothetical protein
VNDKRKKKIIKKKIPKPKAQESLLLFGFGNLASTTSFSLSTFIFIMLVVGISFHPAPLVNRWLCFASFFILPTLVLA